MSIEGENVEWVMYGLAYTKSSETCDYFVHDVIVDLRFSMSFF